MWSRPASRDRPAGELPQDRHQERVEDRDEQDQDRHRQHGQEAARTPAGGVQERRAGQEEADEHRAAVAHEDGRRVRIVHQESQQPGPEDGEHQGLGRLSVAQEGERQEGGGDRGDAGRQPVHVVEQVDGVGDTDQPEEGDRHVDRRRSGPGQGQPAPDDRRRPHDLTAQLLVGLEVEEVVDEPDQEQEAPAQSTTRACGVSGTRARLTAATTVKIAPPPSRAVGFLCQRSLLGRATTPRAAPGHAPPGSARACRRTRGRLAGDQWGSSR